MNIINLTMHPATHEQKLEGVIDTNQQDSIKQLLYFRLLPSETEIYLRAKKLADIASEQALLHQCEYVMIGGPAFMAGPLEEEIRFAGLTPVYAFYVKEAVKLRNPDGTAEKISVCRHKGFIEGAL